MKTLIVVAVFAGAAAVALLTDWIDPPETRMARFVLDRHARVPAADPERKPERKDPARR